MELLENTYNAELGQEEFRNLSKTWRLYALTRRQGGTNRNEDISLLDGES